MKSARAASYEALIQSYKNETYLSDALAAWEKSDHPRNDDFRLAQEISHGTMRMTRALDALAKQLCDTKRLKLKERVLLRMALYQFYFMNKIPLYAIVNESITLAKKTCHSTFVKFLNAILRKLESTTLSLPKEFGIAYSYPDELIEQLIIDYGKKQAVEILQLGNQPSETFVRQRKTASYKPVKSLEPYLENTQYYIQNPTPGKLFAFLQSQRKKAPEKILDLCASPGGKSLLLHDAYPHAMLTANDVSEEKTARLRDNFQKYEVNATITQSRGEEFASEELFDLIVIDAPCSNTGVLNKRSEARWRYTKENLEALKTLQLSLLGHASSLLAKEGQIWFMTCSILKQENEAVAEEACRFNHLQFLDHLTVLPSSNGQDGGFAAVLQLST